ncbi:hypothetical protein STEG23_033186 [Scotinomys teguina]
MNNEIEEKKNKKLEEMNNEIEEKKNKRVEEMNKEIEEKRNKKLQELDKEMEEKINKKLKEMNKEIEEKTNKKLEEINKVIEEKTNKKLEEINKEIEEKTNKKLEKINKEIDGKKTKEVEEMKKEIEEKLNKKWGEMKKFEEKKNKRLEEMNKENEEKTNKKMEDLKKVLKESQDNQQKTIKHMKETTQDIKIEIEKLKKTLSEGMLEIEKLSKRSGNTDASITNRIQEMEDRISNAEDTIEEIDSTVKENTKTKKVIKQNVQEIWDTIKRSNIRIIGIEEGEEYQLKGTENIFNKIIEENFPNLKKEPPIKIQEAYRTPNRLDPQKKSSRHIIIKTLNIQNKERILRAAKEKGQLTYKGRPIRITSDFSMETLQARRYLANDMEEDNQAPKQDMFYILYGKSYIQRPMFHKLRFQLIRSMGWRTWVSREECEELVSISLYPLDFSLQLEESQVYAWIPELRKWRQESCEFYALYPKLHVKFQAGLCYRLKLSPVSDQTKPNQTKPNQTKPNQTKPNQTKPNQTKPNQTKPNQTKPNQTKPNNPIQLPTTFPQIKLK